METSRHGSYQNRILQASRSFLEPQNLNQKPLESISLDETFSQKTNDNKSLVLAVERSFMGFRFLTNFIDNLGWVLLKSWKIQVLFRGVVVHPA